MKKQAIFCLLSGGLDSTTCLYKAIEDFPEASRFAISVDYGQKHSKELDCAAHICKIRGFNHQVLSMPVGSLSGLLTSKTEKVPDCSYSDIKGISPTYVSFRNGTMLSLIAAKAQQWTKDKSTEAFIYFGAHAEDAADWAYPDCSNEFIGAMANAIFIGTYQRVRLVAPLQNLTKSGVVKLGAELSVPFELTWSCYKGLAKHCGTCPTCISRKEAFIDAGLNDPTEYMK